LHTYHKNLLTNYSVPKGSKIMHAGTRANRATIWFERPVDFDPSENETLRCTYVPTGQAFDPEFGYLYGELEYVGTSKEVDSFGVEYFYHVYASIG
jgi:hypothetical protein